MSFRLLPAIAFEAHTKRVGAVVFKMVSAIGSALAVAILSTLASVPALAHDRELNPLTDTHVYVGEVNNHGNAPGQIAVFSVAARGNVAPEYVLGGPKTGVWAPRDMTWDAHGNLYVIDQGYHSHSGSGECARLLEFRPNSRGNAVPERRLEGKRTDFCDGVGGVAVDRAGNVFISALYHPYLCFFSPNKRGDAAPTRIISVNYDNPGYLALVGNNGEFLVSETNEIVEYYMDGQRVGQIVEPGFATAFALRNGLVYAPSIESNVFTVASESDHTTKYAFPYPKHAFWSASADGNGSIYILYDPPRRAQLPPEILVYAPGARKPSRSIGGSRTTLTNYGVARVGP